MDVFLIIILIYNLTDCSNYGKLETIPEEPFEFHPWSFTVVLVIIITITMMKIMMTTTMMMNLYNYNKNCAKVIVKNKLTMIRC